MLLKRSSLALLAVVCLPAALLAQSITGTVTNKTNGKPASGDTVTLIKLANGMQEANHTITDARGHFTLPVDDQGMHLVRVTHARVPYFAPVPPGKTTADVEVYDSADKVAGVSLEADVMKMQATNSSLEVTELFALKNESSPARTQFGAKAFELWLPEGAQITSGAALGPGGMPVQAMPVPLGDAGHYAFVFPVRPGATRFQLAYKLPYTGSFAFHPKISLPAENLAVMLPKSMHFDPASGTAYQPVNDDVNAQVFLIKGAAPGQPLGFTASGTGEMPRDAGDQAAPNAEGGSTTDAQNTAANGRPGGGLGNPIDTPDPLHKYRWWVLGAIGVLFVAGVTFAMRKPREPLGQETSAAYPPPVSSTSASQGNGTLLHVLKEEMFRLETDRVAGKISDERYAQVKAALETVLRYALEQNPPGASRV